MKTIAMFICFCFLWVFPVGAQKNDQVHVTLTGNVAVPSADFKQAVNNNMGGLGVGAGATVLVNPRMKTQNSPILVGVDLNYISFGREKTEQTGSTPPYKTSFNLFTAGLALRILPRVDRPGFNPFLDGTLGLNIANARTKIDKDIFDTLNNEEDNVLGSVTYNGLGYGVGLGFYNRRIRSDEARAIPRHLHSVLFIIGGRT